MNSVSEPPINITEKNGEKVTFADVAMRLVRDGPMYGVIILVGLLAITGKATANETIMGSALALLARSWPGAIQTGGGSQRHYGLIAIFGALTATQVIGCLP